MAELPARMPMVWVGGGGGGGGVESLWRGVGEVELLPLRGGVLKVGAVVPRSDQAVGGLVVKQWDG